MAKKINKNTAVLALVINLVLPGVGSIIGGKVGAGVGQLIISLIGVFFVGIATMGVASFIGLLLGVFYFIGIPLMLIGWIWALVTGITLVQEAK